MSAAYPLTIELFRNTGGHDQYTANAQVRVINQAGRVVLDATADGPYMLVSVPPGQYRVQASLNGQSLESKPVQVGAAGGAKATLSFGGTN
jgi:outer membrane usher protein FimD/PapC